MQVDETRWRRGGDHDEIIVIVIADGDRCSNAERFDNLGERIRMAHHKRIAVKPAQLRDERVCFFAGQLRHRDSENFGDGRGGLLRALVFRRIDRADLGVLQQSGQRRRTRPARFGKIGIFGVAGFAFFRVTDDENGGLRRYNWNADDEQRENEKEAFHGESLAGRFAATRAIL